MPSDANYSAVAAVRETTWGTTPASAFQAMRLVSETLAHNKDTVVSDEVRSDRQISDLIEVGANAAGGINFELSYTAWLEWLEAALFTTKVVINLTAISADLVASTGTITAAGGTWANVIPGTFFRVQGFTNPLNNKIAMVKSKTSTDLVFGAGVFAADQTGATISVKGTGMKNGTTRSSYTIERSIPNAAGVPVFQAFTGMCIDTLTLSLESKKVITGALGFVGKQGASGTATTSTGAYTAAATDPVMNATSNVATLTKDGAAMSEKAKTLSLSIKNNLRALDAIANRGSFEVGVGEFNLTGSLNVYFHSEALFAAFVAHGYSSLAFVVTDGAGNSLGVHIPRLNFSAGNPQITGKNTDNMQQMDFQAILDPTYGATMFVSFIPAAT